MLIKTHKYFNQLTRQALLDHVNGYVDKSSSVINEISRLKTRYGVKNIYRFDLGENADGFSPVINDYLKAQYQGNNLGANFNCYPDESHRKLRDDISQFFNIARDQIVISAGLDSMLDLIARVFFDYKDFYLMAVPDFFLFENYSERMGAMPLFIQLDARDNFAWTEKTLRQYADSIQRFKPKIAWLSNPGNPTGQIVPNEIILEIIKIAQANNVFVVIDEAYGEYIKNNQGSAVKYLSNYENLIVLRTFSKAYGLAGIRLGYLMSSSIDIIEALLLHRQHFPVMQMALDMASIALNDQHYINETIRKTNTRRNDMFNALNSLKTFEYIPSSTNIFMLKNRFLTDDKLYLLLKRRGIITSLLNITGINNKYYVRVTVRQKKDNNELLNACTDIEKEIVESIKIPDKLYKPGIGVHNSR